MQAHDKCNVFACFYVCSVVLYFPCMEPSLLDESNPRPTWPHSTYYFDAKPKISIMQDWCPPTQSYLQVRQKWYRLQSFSKTHFVGQDAVHAHMVHFNQPVNLCTHSCLANTGNNIWNYHVHTKCLRQFDETVPNLRLRLCIPPLVGSHAARRPWWRQGALWVGCRQFFHWRWARRRLFSPAPKDSTHGWSGGDRSH